MLPAPSARSNGSFLIQIDDEQMLVTSVDLADNTVQVTRGVNGTTPADHTAGAGAFAATDQRGLARQVDGQFDIGAYQTQQQPVGDWNLAVTGSNQSAFIDSNFATQLTVTVTDSLGNPVVGAEVAFTLPGTGPGGSLSGGAMGITDSDGEVIDTLTANDSSGSYSIDVSVSGGGNPDATIAELTNLAAPANLTITGDDQKRDRRHRLRHEPGGDRDRRRRQSHCRRAGDVYAARQRRRRHAQWRDHGHHRQQWPGNRDADGEHRGRQLLHRCAGRGRRRSRSDLHGFDQHRRRAGQPRGFRRRSIGPGLRHVRPGLDGNRHRPVRQPRGRVAVTFTPPTTGASGTLSGGDTVQTNGNGQVVEMLTANGLGGTYSIPVAVSGGSNPSAEIDNLTNGFTDVVPTSLQVSSPVESGNSVTVSWNDQNLGNQAVSGAYYDAIDVFTSTGYEIVHNVVAGDSTLAGGDSSPMSDTFTLPAGAQGAGDLQIVITQNYSGGYYPTIQQFDSSGNPVSTNTANIDVTSTLEYTDVRADLAAGEQSGGIGRTR